MVSCVPTAILALSLQSLSMAVGRVEAGGQFRWWSRNAWRCRCPGGSLVFSLHCSLGEPSLLPRWPVPCQVGEEVSEVVSQQLLEAVRFVHPASISLLSSQVNLWRLTTRWSSTSGMRRRPVTRCTLTPTALRWARLWRTTSLKSNAQNSQFPSVSWR